MFSHIKELFTRPSGYNISRSVRLRSSASAYFNRTPASASNRKTWTWSGWVKRGVLGSTQVLFIGYIDINNKTRIDIASTDILRVYDITGGSTERVKVYTTQVFRDPSAWYHVVVTMDTTQATAANRTTIYINGIAVSSLSSAVYAAQNTDLYVDAANAHAVGGSPPDSLYFDGYLTEINFIDGQALTPSSFGETDSITGVWKAKKYGGTYGTNGFYLNFSDNSNNTAATIGKDYSGNGNNWTPNNISVTAGSTYDSMTDVPTLTSATAANYAVMNPLIKSYASQSWALTNGNLQATDSGSGGGWCLGTIAATSGKWYWEGTITAVAKAIGVGWTTISNISFGYNGCYQSGGNVNNASGTLATTFASFTTNDVIGVAVDVSNGKVWFSKNGTFLGSGDPVAGTNTAFTFTGGTESSPTFCIDNSAGTSGVACNFGQRPFSYTPPTGYVALNTFNLPDSTIKNGAAYMAATTYTGNGGTQTVSNSGNFQPDLVWIKSRSNAQNHVEFDAVRGQDKVLYPNLTNGEDTLTGQQAFASTGFTLGGGYANTNASGYTYVGWQWKAGGTSSSNTNGSITSTVSVGATQGFSVVTYTGNGSAGATFGHGLGVAPNFVIIKERGNVNGWLCYHISTGNTGYLELDATLSFQTLSTFLNNTTPSSSVVTLGTVSNVNRNGGTFVAYCFAAVKGFSAFGSYTGNGSTDGPFVYCGFRPRWIMLKRTDSAADWFVGDTSRNTANSVNNLLQPSSANAESTYGAGAGEWYDLLSNGFKIRSTISSFNASGGTYIYAAFAENPFKNSLAR